MDLVIVTSHWKEDLEWLKKSKWPVVVIDKEGSDPSWITPQHTIPNKGREVSVYLKYIIENYDNLPNHVAFIHGHENSWHQFHDRPLLDLIEHANVQEHEFISLNNFMKWYGFINEPTEEYMQIETYWDLFQIDQKKPPKFSLLQSPIGAQFIVSKNRILRNTKEDYQRWYKIVMEVESSKDLNISTFFELVWHIIFGEEWICKFPSTWFNIKTVQEAWYHDVYKEQPQMIGYVNYVGNTLGYTEAFRAVSKYF